MAGSASREVRDARLFVHLLGQAISHPSLESLLFGCWVSRAWSRDWMSSGCRQDHTGSCETLVTTFHLMEPVCPALWLRGGDSVKDPVGPP